MRSGNPRICEDTRYDDLLLRGVERRYARGTVYPEVSQILDRWEHGGSQEQRLFFEIPQYFQNEDNRGNQMKAQVKYIDRFGEGAIFEHDQFFKHMRHGAKWGKQHEYGSNDENRIGYLVQKIQHILGSH